MKNYLLFSLIALSTGFSLIIPEPAKADLAVCNHSNKKAFVAVAYYADNKWNSWGWTHVYSGECETVYQGNVSLNPPYLYIADNDWNSWSIDNVDRRYDFCIRQTSFDIEYADGECGVEGMFPVTFERVTSNGYDLDINLR